MVWPTDMEKSPPSESTTRRAQSINSNFDFLKPVMASGGRQFRHNKNGE
jgi:hypothetical protein